MYQAAGSNLRRFFCMQHSFCCGLRGSIIELEHVVGLIRIEQLVHESYCLHDRMTA